jgi:EmrB/QacA subfamily drug resistance transporter
VSQAHRAVERLDPAMWRIAAVAAIGSFMAQLDATIVNVSLSSLATELRAGIDTVQWVTSGYLLALALTLPLNGWLVARIGTKRLYLGCFVAFTLSSALCGAAGSAGSLIGFRILQGMCGGLLAPMAQMMIARAAGARFAQVVGFVAAPVLLAPLLGPVIAGALLQFASWRWLFFINLPVGVLALGMAYAFLPDDERDYTSRGLDVVGLALLSPGLVLFLYGSEHLNERAGGAAVVAALLMLAMFYASARRKGDASLIDLRLFEGETFAASLTSMFLMNGVAFAGQMLVPIYLVRECGFSPSRTGWLMAPLGLGMMCTYPFMGKLTDRFGVRQLAAGGAVLAGAGVATLAFMAAYGMILPLFVGALFVRGVGMSTIGVPSMSAAYASVARQDLPMATSAMNIIQRLGGPILTTMVATYLGWRIGPSPTPDQLSGAFAAAFVLLCGLHVLLFVAALRLPVAIEPSRLPA